MKSVLVLGAGRSSVYLIRRICESGIRMGWNVTVADQQTEEAQKKTAGFANAAVAQLNAADAASRRKLIGHSDLVISLLPPAMHIEVAKDCLMLKKHLCTASYVSPEMEALAAEAEQNELIFLNEAGLDPGIDHMSAMKIIHRLQGEGARITGFESYCGGLVTPESEAGNPWKYRITWNPMNVVLAGQGTPVRFLHEGREKLIPYHRLFAEASRMHIEGVGDFEAYANRDSLKYITVYGLKDIRTLVRGTLRRPPFCKSWNLLVKAGITDHSTVLHPGKDAGDDLLCGSFFGEQDPRAAFRKLGADEEDMNLLDYLGIFSARLDLNSAKTGADYLLDLVSAAWKMSPEHHDRVVMLHRFRYEKAGEQRVLNSWMCADGEDAQHTAMAKTVGLPLAMCAEAILTGTYTRKGVSIPVHEELYLPVLAELEKNGIGFSETDEIA